MSDSILWIVPKWPLPANDGARVATVNLLRSLVAKKIGITLCAFVDDPAQINTSIALKEIGVQDVILVPYKEETNLYSGIISHLIRHPLLPLTFRKYTSRHGKKVFKDSLCEKPWDTVVYDGLHPSALHNTFSGRFESPWRPESSILYRAHNREAQLWYRKAELCENPLLSFAYSQQGKMIQRGEDTLVDVCSGLAAVSLEDLLQFDVPEYCTGRVVPIGFDFGSPLPYHDHLPLSLLFVGRLDWPPNKEGLLWFFDNVWEKVLERSPDIHLEIIGSGNSEWVEHRISGVPNTTLHGRVDSLSPFYEMTHACIVPLFYGSGTRVKVVEASGFSRACVSTAVGVEGLGLSEGTSYIRGETAQEWIDALVALSHQHLSTIGRAAYDEVVEKFSFHACAETFIELLNRHQRV